MEPDKMFRKKYDVSGIMATTLPEDDTGVIVTKFTSNEKPDNDNRPADTSYTNVGFIGDEAGNNNKMAPDLISNSTDVPKPSSRVKQDSEIDNSAKSCDNEDASSASKDTKDLVDHSDGEGIELCDLNKPDKTLEQDAGFSDSETLQESGSFKRSYSLGDKPSKRKQESHHASGTRWSVDKYNTPQRAFSCGDKSSSEDTTYSDDAWRLSIEDFTSKRQGSKRKDRKFSKEMRSYYKQQDLIIDTYAELREKQSFYKSQDNLINQFEEVRLELDDAMENAETQKILRKKASFYAKITFATNLVLLCIKVVAVVLSGSISLISSLVDSTVDLVSGLVIWVTTRAVKKTDRYVYPQGRTKLEPMAIVILSVIMSVASLQIIKEAFTKIVGLADTSQTPSVMDWITVGISSATVIAKLVLFLLCRRIPHPTVQALALDHRNDVMSNFVAIIFGYIGSQEMQAKVLNAYGLVYLDPIGAILISIYIIANWIITGWDQIKLLVGHTATSDFISKITWICVDHHKKVEKVDTVRAFHFGNNFLVEVDIVLPPDMTLREAHDIAEPLQQKIEGLPNVERAFVHVDYEFTHHPDTEHKVV